MYTLLCFRSVFNRYQTVAFSTQPVNNDSLAAVYLLGPELLINHFCNSRYITRHMIIVPLSS